MPSTDPAGPRVPTPAAQPSRTPGATPGSLHPPADARPTHLHLFSYTPDELHEATLEDLAEMDEQILAAGVTWLHVEGFADVEVLQAVGERFGLHPLSLEDVVNDNQQPKQEVYDGGLFLVTRLPAEEGEGATEQLSLFAGEGFVVSFSDEPMAELEPIRARLRRGSERIRRRGADFLAYALLDSALDHFFPVVDQLADRLDELEEDILIESADPVGGEILALRRQVSRAVRAIRPMHAQLESLLRYEAPWWHDETQVFMRDCLDHVLRLLDRLGSQKDHAAALMDVHLSLLAQRTNDVMRVLTIIATVFIPLGFIAGLYGMNFDPAASGWNMPELKWAYGYPAALGVMVSVAGGLLLYFWRRGWLGSGERR